MPLTIQKGDTVQSKGPDSATWKVIGIKPESYEVLCSGPGPCRGIKLFRIEDLIVVVADP